MFKLRPLLLAAHLGAAFALPLAASAQSPSTSAPLKVEGAWVRASVPGQSGTGGFMRLTAAEPLTLVGVQSPAAGVAEVHEMKMEGDVMRMRPIGELPLPAGQTVELRSGGYHLMLMSLKAPLKDGAQVPVTLLLRDAKGAERRVSLQAPVALLAPGSAGAAAPKASAPAAHDHGAGHSHGPGAAHRH